MWTVISSIIGGVITPLTNMVTAIYTKKEDVNLEEFKVDGTVDIALVNASVALTQANAGLLGNRWIILLQVGFGLPLMIYYGKCILWDKVLGLGSTDALTGDIGQYSTWIVGFLFLHSAISSWGRKT